MSSQRLVHCCGLADSDDRLFLYRSLLERDELRPETFQLSLLRASEFIDFPAVVCQ